jgi:hypothetical protein
MRLLPLLYFGGAASIYDQWLITARRRTIKIEQAAVKGKNRPIPGHAACTGFATINRRAMLRHPNPCRKMLIVSFRLPLIPPLSHRRYLNRTRQALFIPLPRGSKTSHRRLGSKY